MKKKSCLVFLFLLGILWNVQVHADGVSQPTFHTFKFTDQATLQNMSDNGKWAVAFGTNGNSVEDFPKLIDLATDKATELLSESGTALGNGAYDVNNEGTLVVGRYEGNPAVWTKNNNKWTVLPVPTGWDGGLVNAITPDGKWAIGRATKGQYDETPVLWDMSKGGIITETPNIPVKDMTGLDQHQSRFVGISADGRYIVGCLSFSYIQPIACCYYVYDRDKQTYKFIGFDVDENYKWTPLAQNLAFIDDARISNNGKYITGTAYMVKEGNAEYKTPFLYDVEAGSFSIYDQNQDQGLIGLCCDNEGHVFGASPSDSPAREWSIRVGQYWYSLTQILKQHYNIDFNTASGFENSGTPIALNVEGTKIAVFVYKGESYILEMPQSLVELTNEIDLLANYSVSPEEGSQFSALKSLSLTFDRDIEVTGKSSAVILKDENGNKVTSSVTFKRNANNSKIVDISFRGANLEDGKKYTVSVPAGSIVINGDAEKACKEINISYTGRANKPVTPTSIAPVDNSTLSLLNFSTNPIIINFDAGIALTDTAYAAVYRNNETEPMCELKMAVSSLDSKQLGVYPSAGQYLYKGNEYYVKIKAGSVTDVLGSNPNEAINLHYTGNYEREINYDDVTLFKDDFNNGLGQFLFYEGDKREPVESMAQWGFTATTTPWSIVWDEDNTSDLAAASHSMYSPAGKSDDWMVTTQIFIPSNQCYLRWESQSYLKSKGDRLKIMVWEYDPVLNALNDDLIAKFKNEGKVIYDEFEKPGEDENKLAGEWTSHIVKLEEFKGKNVYIAFVNENEDQSAIFIDNVEVTNDQKFLVGLTNETSVVNQKEIKISGRISINALEDTYQSVHIIMKDANGNAIDEISESGLSLKNGDKYDFAFQKALPLSVGIANKFTLDITLDDEEKTTGYSIKNLAFAPTKRLVIEEFTGTDCPNCPLGILALGNMEKMFGDQIIPMAIHTYDGDIYSTKELEEYSAFLNFSGAPSGVVNRQGGATPVPSYPMASVKNTEGKVNYIFTNGSDLWLDQAEKEFKVAADAELNITAKYQDGKIVVPCTYKYALNATDLNVSLFMAILEDNLTRYQCNNLGGTSDPNLGEWGLGGQYAASVVAPYTFNDVVRSIPSAYYGVSGLIPSSVTAGEENTTNLDLNIPENIIDLTNCKVVCMMIDANTGNIINAARADINTDDYNSIEQTKADESISVNADNNTIHINAGTTAQVTVYSVDGSVLDQVVIEGEGSLKLQGHKGIVLVEVTTENTRVVKKVFVK